MALSKCLLPRRPDAEVLAQGRDFARRAQPADLRNVDADEIDQAPAYEIEPFSRVVEQFTHGEGSGTLLPQDFEISHVLRCERIFKEEEPIRLQLLGEADGINGRQALVHVVEQFNFLAEFLAQILEELRVRA